MKKPALGGQTRLMREGRRFSETRRQLLGVSQSIDIFRYLTRGRHRNCVNPCINSAARVFH